MKKKRQRPSLRPPAALENLHGFPQFLLADKRPIFRLVRDGLGPWWFSSSLNGRFDLPAPEGTCYLASDELGAILEHLGPELLPGGCVPASLLTGRHVRELRVPRPFRLADSLRERAVRWVTAELSTLVPYGMAQAWARAFRGAGYEGVRYSTRHSTSRRRESYALFDASGERRWKRGRRIASAAKYRDQLRARCGIEVFDVPSSHALTFAT